MAEYSVQAEEIMREMRDVIKELVSSKAPAHSVHLAETVVSNLTGSTVDLYQYGPFQPAHSIFTGSAFAEFDAYEVAKEALYRRFNTVHQSGNFAELNHITNSDLNCLLNATSAYANIVRVQVQMMHRAKTEDPKVA